MFKKLTHNNSFFVFLFTLIFICTFTTSCSTSVDGSTAQESSTPTIAISIPGLALDGEEAQPL